MIHYLVELALWLLAAFFLGCVLGAAARRYLGQAPQQVPEIQSEDLIAAGAGIPLAPMPVREALEVEKPHPITPLPMAPRLPPAPFRLVEERIAVEVEEVQQQADPRPEHAPSPGHAPMAPRWHMMQDDKAEEWQAVEREVDRQDSIIEIVSRQDRSIFEGSASPAVQPGPVVAIDPALRWSDTPEPPAPRKPQGLSGPRLGRADDLQRISGVGPKYERILNELGCFHFDQICQWTDEQIDWVDAFLKFNGRIRRENWVEQCRLLANGQEEEFRRLYGSGGEADVSGRLVAGERTRRS